MLNFYYILKRDLIQKVDKEEMRRKEEVRIYERRDKLIGVKICDLLVIRKEKKIYVNITLK